MSIDEKLAILIQSQIQLIFALQELKWLLKEGESRSLCERSINDAKNILMKINKS